MKPLAIYIHIPFCKRKCAYCDFVSYVGCEALYERYFDALFDEIDAWREKIGEYHLQSIFFGGGTPTLVPAEKIAETIERIDRATEIGNDVEITIEANPGTVDAKKLEAYRRAGVNRISFGVQSFDEAILKSIGRIHTPEQAKAAVLLAKDNGFEHISIDLMYALPKQDMRIWRESLQTALALPLDHISAYSLIVEENTMMGQWVREGIVSLPDEDSVNEMQRMAIVELERAGFHRYEISNFARPDGESRHNIAYWQDIDYLGLGCAAHSLMENKRFSNPILPEEYIGGIRMTEISERTVEDQKEEIIMLSTRMVRGLDLMAWKRKFNEDFEAHHQAAIQKLENYGLIEIENGFLRLTEVGMELHNAVVLEFLDA